MEPSIASVSVDRSPERTPNTFYVHLSGGATAKGYSSGPTTEQEMPVRSYNSKRELHWDYERPPGGRRRSLRGIAGVAAAAAAVALLSVVFLLLSCGVSISHTAKATQAWGGGRQLASSEDEVLCTKTATAAREAAASGGGAGEVTDGEGAGEAAAEAAAGEAAADGTEESSSRNPAAPTFSPRGPIYAGEGATEAYTAAGGNHESSVSRSEGNASPDNPETGREEAAAAGSAAAEEALGTGAAGVVSVGEHRKAVPLLWPAGVHKAIALSPFLGLFLTRLRELAVHCRDYFNQLPPHHARLVGEELLRYAVIELAALRPFCTLEQERQRGQVVKAFIRLARSLGARAKVRPAAATTLDSLLTALNLLKESGPLPVVWVQNREHAAEHILRPAGAALRHMGTAVNSLLESLQGHPPAVPPAVLAAQVAVITAVTKARLLQALSEDAAAQALHQLQSKCSPLAIFNQDDVLRSQQVFFPGNGPEKARVVDAAAWEAEAAAVAATGQGGTRAQPRMTAAGAAVAPAAGEGRTAPGWLAIAGVEQQRGGQQLPQLQQQQERAFLEQRPLQQPSPAAQPLSRQGGISAATRGLTATTAEAMRVMGVEGLRSPLTAPSFPPPLLPPMLPHVPLPHPPPLQLLPATPASSSFFLQSLPQMGIQQMQLGPSPQQQQLHIGLWSHLPQPHLHAGEVWGPLLPQQGLNHLWYVAGFDRADEGPSRAFLQPSGDIAHVASLPTSESSYSESIAERMGSIQGRTFATPVVPPGPTETAYSEAHQPQQQQQQQRPQAASRWFRGTDYTVPLATQEEAANRGAQLLHQHQLQQLQHASADLWSLGDIASSNRQDILRGSLAEQSPPTQHHASGGDTPQTPAQTPAIDSRPTADPNSGVK
ncbi:uncharacterized protein EMH_0024530 [Eimeria mitis]|uniref:Uncharacterized protein n=1 Tax=Eimeria mitis TaxID=44415 RepID=U6KEH3_9EIME|nr:uncharacterized protein EMH_0024530 [Eimeria mitis]CDJ35206.1 hypothetical protein EMH_0024530 [Eimeria mitis]